MKHRKNVLAWICTGIIGGLAMVAPAEAKKPRKISIADDPTLGERTAELVMIEISDFQ